MSRAREILLALGLALFAALLVAPHWGEAPAPTADGLFYEAQQRELEGEPAAVARREVFESQLAAPLRRGEADLPPARRRYSNPEWIAYSAQFYRRRWTVSAAAAALDPLFGDRSLATISLLGYVLVGPLLFALLRRRFSIRISAAIAAAALLLGPLRDFSIVPLTDSWGLALEIAGLLAAALVFDRGPRWLAAWIGVVALLSLTRDATVVLVAGAGLAALLGGATRTRIALLGGGIAAALPAPLIFSAPLRDNLAYVFNDFRVPNDTSWSRIAGDYPSQLAGLLGDDLAYPIHSAIPPLGVLAALVVLLAAVALFAAPRGLGGDYLNLHRGALIGAVLTLLISVNYTGLRLELAALPPLAVGLAVLLNRFQWWRGPARATDSSVRGADQSGGLEPASEATL